MSDSVKLSQVAEPHAITVQLKYLAEQLAALRKQRDQLIRAHEGTLREIAGAAGLSHQAVANIKARKEEK